MKNVLPEFEIDELVESDPDWDGSSEHRSMLSEYYRFCASEGLIKSQYEDEAS